MLPQDPDELAYACRIAVQLPVANGNHQFAAHSGMACAGDRHDAVAGLGAGKQCAGTDNGVQPNSAVIGHSFQCLEKRVGGFEKINARRPGSLDVLGEDIPVVVHELPMKCFLRAGDADEV